MLKIECVYCGKHMGYKDGEGVTGISHSVCDECFKIEMDKINNELPEINKTI